MISMENWATQAHEKLNKERSAVSGSKERAMADAVLSAIKEFCRQEPEFAQAVVQSGAFADCMNKVASGVGNYISDLEAYKKAVQFYFPGAEIHMVLTIDLVGTAAGETLKEIEPAEVPTPAPLPETGKGKILNLDLDDLFSF